MKDFVADLLGGHGGVENLDRHALGVGESGSLVDDPKRTGTDNGDYGVVCGENGKVEEEGDFLLVYHVYFIIVFVICFLCMYVISPLFVLLI